MNVGKEAKIYWISILQGWSMLLVVIGHVTLTNIFENPATPVSTEVERIIYGFHMPLFMFISGGLFYYTKIRKGKKYGVTIRDKAKRLLAPFIFFTLATFVLKYIFNPLMKRPVELSFKQIINSILYPASNPLGEMWFIITLFIIFLFYPVFKWSLQWNKCIVSVWITALLLNLFFPKDIEILCFSQVAYYLVYFYSGLLFFKFDAYKYTDTKCFFVVSLMFFVLFNILVLPVIFLTFTGIAFSVALCLLLSHYWTRLFSSFRDYTFQIFLMCLFFQMGIRFLYAKLDNELLYWPLYVLSILLALYMPVLISKMIQKIESPFIHQCFGL